MYPFPCGGNLTRFDRFVAFTPWAVGSIMIPHIPETSAKSLGNTFPLPSFVRSADTLSTKSAGVCSTASKKSTSNSEMYRDTFPLMRIVDSIFVFTRILVVASDSSSTSFLSGFLGEMKRPRPFRFCGVSTALVVLLACCAPVKESPLEF